MARPEAGHDASLETNGRVSARDAQLRADLERIAKEAEVGAQVHVPAARTEVDPAVLAQQQAANAREVISQQPESGEVEEPHVIDVLIDRVQKQNPSLVIDESGALNRQQVMALAAEVRSEDEKDGLLAGLYRRGMFEERSLPDGSNELAAKDDNAREALAVLNALERQLEDGRQANEEVAAARKADKEHKRETQRLMQANNGINDGHHKVEGSSVGWREDDDVVGKEQARRSGVVSSISVPLSGTTVPIGEAHREPDAVIHRAGVKPGPAEVPTPDSKMAEDPEAIMARMLDRMGLDEKGRPVTDRAREIHGKKDAAKAAAEAVSPSPSEAKPAAASVSPEAGGDDKSKLKTAYEIAEEKARAADEAAKAAKAAKTAGSGGVTDTEYQQAFDIAKGMGPGRQTESHMSPQELHELIKNAKDADELAGVFGLAVGSGHLNVDGGVRTRGESASDQLTARTELAKELAEKLAKMPRTVEKARLEGRLAAGREELAEQARDQIRNLGAGEADKQRAWEAALGEDREAFHQAALAEQFNAMRDSVRGDVMLQRQIEAARDAATVTEKQRQQEITQEVGERVAAALQRGYTREVGSSLLDRRSANFEEMALMARDALGLERAPFIERRTQGIVESDFRSSLPNMDNVLVRERRDARTGVLLSQNILSLTGEVHVGRRGRIALPEELQAIDEQSLYQDVQERGDLGRPRHNLRGDLSDIYRTEYGARDTDIAALRADQNRRRGRVGRAVHRVRQRGRRVADRVGNRWRRLMG